MTSMVLLVAAIMAADRIDLDGQWRFRHDPHHVGIEQQWQSPGQDDTFWVGMNVGQRWEEQGFPDGDGHGWYRKWVDVPRDWVGKPVWFVIGGVNDACTVYCNGEKINTYGDEHDGNSLYQTIIVAEIGGAIKFAGANLITVDVHDWGGSGGLWRTPCFVTANPKQLPLDTVFNAIYTSRDAACITVDVMGLGLDRGAMTVEATYKDAGQIMHSKRTLAAGETFAVLDLPVAFKEFTDVSVSVLDAQGDRLAGFDTSFMIGPIEFAAWPGEYSELKVLNNFVTELLQTAVDGAGEWPFQNPRDGWVYIRAAGEAAPKATVNDGKTPLIWRVNPDDAAHEAMIKLAAGKHTIRISEATKGTVDVRAVPELTYSAYPGNPSIKPYGPYDWAFLERHVLSHVNTIITHANAPDDHFNHWLGEGRAWLDGASAPNLYAPAPPDPAEAAAAWLDHAGATDPRYAGLIVDEFFWSGADYYAAWADAVKLLYADPRFEGHTLYAWCLELYAHGAAQPFLDALLKAGGCLAWEKYLIEKKTEEEAWADIARLMVTPYRSWKRQTPDLGKQMMMTLGYMSMPSSGFNHQPGADYQVFKDMQYFTMATDPVFRDLRGLMEFTASAADEEAVRWSHRLIRHYCIEGRTDRFTSDPYELPHLSNPDFAEGLLGWNTYGDVKAETIPAYGFVQGRYPKSGQGDAVCVLGAGSETNSIAQRVQQLEPGQVYSLKVVSANRDALGENRPAPLIIDIEQAERDAGHSFTFVYPSANADAAMPQPSYFTYHRIVFTAGSQTPLLTITAEKGGEPVALNYVELAPYR